MGEMYWLLFSLFFFHFFPQVAVLNFYDIIFTRIFGFTSIICRMYILKVCGILFSHVIAFIDIILRVQFFLKYLRQKAEEKNLLHSHSLYFVIEISFIQLIPNTSTDRKRFTLRYAIRTYSLTDAIAQISTNRIQICNKIQNEIQKDYSMRFYFYFVRCSIFMNKLIRFNNLF